MVLTSIFIGAIKHKKISNRSGEVFYETEMRTSNSLSPTNRVLINNAKEGLRYKSCEGQRGIFLVWRVFRDNHTKLDEPGQHIELEMTEEEVIAHCLRSLGERRENYRIALKSNGYVEFN